MMRKSTAASKDDSITTGSGGTNGRQQQQQQGGSYSSIVGSLQSQNGTETRTARGDNPFKYGKDEMMQVYSSMVANGDKVSHAPLDFERYEQVSSSKPVQPVSMSEPNEEEKTLLSGNINSEQKPRRADLPEARQNGRRDNRQGGGPRESKKHEYRKATDEPIQRGVPASGPMNGKSSHDVDDSSNSIENNNDSAREASHEPPRSQLPGRNTSRLATLGVFDTNTESNGAKWKDEKDEDVLKEAMGYTDAGNQEFDKLTDMYQNQSLGASQQSQASRSFTEQYKPLSNGLPDLFPKNANNSAGFTQSQQTLRGGFLESTPSPGLPMRQDPPMTRVMVMPDKLKWQYRDPTGQNQGPFSGLEMHDWYKAGFFQPNLLVKREEDEDFEPLSILVRRIGNQREPFLVPLPSRVSVAAPARTGSQDGKDSWPNGQNWSGGGQPPFPQSFPSFGTTLTAEQQNALERRKQEEQYLMHRQREFLQQQQMAQQMAAQRLLHHQHPYGHNGQQFGYGTERRGSPFSSGSERQGSMNSFDLGASAGAGAGNAGWGGYTPQNQTAQRGPYTDFGAGIFDTPKSEVAEQSFREHEKVAGQPRDEFNNNIKKHDHTVNTIFQQKSGQNDYASRMAQQAQAMQLQAESARKETNNNRSPSEADSSFVQTQRSSSVLQDEPTETSFDNKAEHNKSDNSNTDLPNVQQGSPGLADSPSASHTVPWAAVSTKGRSLKEIQELEAKRDALRRQAERKLALEVQAAAQAQAESLASQTPVAHVTPLNWAQDSATESVGSPSAAWKASASTPGKKTLAQIQEEEEQARRAKVAMLAKAAVHQQGSVQSNTAAMGARYAESAMKNSAPSWSTVGAGGRASIPATPRVAEQKLAAVVPIAPKTRTPVSTAVVIPTRPSDPDAISPEFLSWARSALKGLNPGVNFAEFLQLLLSFGTDGGKDTREIISDSIYANSATLDGRRFADEFCKRRKEDLKNPHGQNKSISDLTSTLASASASSNGWSDVVKTKPVKQDQEEEWNTSFKLQTKKSGKRK